MQRGLNLNIIEYTVIVVIGSLEIPNRGANEIKYQPVERFIFTSLAYLQRAPSFYYIMFPIQKPSKRSLDFYMVFLMQNTYIYAFILIHRLPFSQDTNALPCFIT